MPEVIGAVSQDSNTINTYFIGTANTTTQNFYFQTEQDAMFFISKGDSFITLTVNGESYKIPPKGSIRINDGNFTSFDVSTQTGSQSFEITSTVLKNDIQDVRTIAIQASSQSGNLFKPFGITNGYLVNTDGTLAANVNWAASDYIPVQATKQYYCTNVRSIAFYDSNKTYIAQSSNVYVNTRDHLYVRAPFNAAYVRFASSLANMTSGSFSFSQVKIPPRWVSQIWAAIGDSLTANNNWQPFVTEALGVVHSNFGVGGTKVADTTGTDTTAMCRDERINLIALNTSLVTIMGGTNDWSQGVALGAITDTVTTSYYGGLKKAVEKVLTRVPTARVIILTPPFCKYPNKGGWADTTGIKNNLNLTIGDYAKAAQDVAKYYGLPCIDLNGLVGWNDVNFATYLTNEGFFFHPNVEGGKRIAEVVTGVLKGLEPLPLLV